MRRAVAIAASLIVIAGLIPATAATAQNSDEPAVVTPLESEPPVNEVPDEAYTPPAEEPEVPPQPTATAPPEGSPQAEASAAFNAEAAAQVSVVDDQLTLDRVEGERPPTESTEIDPAIDEALHQAAFDADGSRAPPGDSFKPQQEAQGHDPVEEQLTPESVASSPAEREQVSAAQSAQSACAPVPGAPYQGRVVFEQNVTPIHNAQSGAYFARLTNTGAQSWPVGTTISYQVFDTNAQPVAGTRPSTQAPIATGSTVQANGGWITFNATVGALPPGTWLLAWDIFVPGVGWLTGQGNCSSNLQLTVSNQSPTITYQGPASPGTVATKTPQLTVATTDPDVWPVNGSLSHTFKICRNAELTSGCVTGNSGSTRHWTPPALEWGVTYYWSVSVSDGQATTDGSNRVQAFTVVVPSADDWRQVGNGLGLAEVFGVVLPYGIFLHHQTDAEVGGGDFPLSIKRTYSSGAANTEGAFGRGWLSLFDANVVWNANTNLLRVTYPDGRQESFGKSGSEWIARAELGTSTRVTSFSTQRTVVKQASGETVTYETSSGRLLKVEMAGQESWELTYANGVATRVTHQPSGRSVNVEWATPSGSCTSGQGATRPYVSALSVDRGAGQNARWTYGYTCSRLVTTTDPLGGVHRYSSTATTFSATTPEGRQTRQLSAAGTWTDVSQNYQERVIRVGEPGSMTRSIRLLRPLAGYENWYRTVYNPLNGVTALYCGYRDNVNGTESCGKVYDTLQFDTLGRLREKAIRLEATGPGTGTFRYWLYNAQNGQLMGMTDENENTVEYRWDAWGNLAGSFMFRDPWTQVTSTNYYAPDPGDPNGPTRLRGSSVSPQTFPEGVPMSEFTAQYTYDTKGRLVAHDGPTVPGVPNGEQRSYTYTAGTEAAVRADGSVIAGKTMPAGLLRTETTSAGSTRSSYDERGDLTRVETPGGGTIQRTYDARGAVLTELVNGTALVQYTYDALGRATREDQTCIENALSGLTTRLVIDREYDRDGLPKSIREREVDCGNGAQLGDARTTRYTYTAQGRPATVTDAAGGVTRYEYSAANPDQMIKVTDSRGRVTENVYRTGTGELSNTKVDVGVLGSTTRVSGGFNQYDPAGHKIWESDILGRSTSYTVTPDGFVTKASRSGVPVNGTTRTVNLWERSFDGAGNMTREKVAESRVTDYTFDAMNRLYQSVLDPSGLNRVSRIERDAAGRETGRIAGDRVSASRVMFGLNAAGYVTSERVWLDADVLNLAAPSLTTKHERDLWGNARQTTDPRGVMNLEEEEKFSSGILTDKLGRAVQNLGPLTVVEAPSSTEGPDAYTVAEGASSRASEDVVYNAFGDVIATTDANGALTEYRYDSGGRLTETHLPDYTDAKGAVVDAVIRYQYSAAGDLIKKTDARGGVTDFAYDVAGNVVRQEAPVHEGKRATSRFAYNAGNQLVESWDTKNVRTTYAYDVLGRLVAETVKARTNPADAASATRDYTTSHTYDLIGNRTSTTTPQGRTTRFEYNASGERTALWLPGRTAPARWEYDHVGRVTKEVESSGRAIEHVFDGAGREVRTVQRGIDGSTLTTSRTFDAAGNVIAEQDPRGITKTFAYDGANRLVTMTQPTGVNQSYSVLTGYDAVGNPVRVRNGNGVNTWYTYNSWNLRTSVVEAPTTRHPALEDRRWTTRYDVSGNAVELTKPGGATVATQYDPLNRATATQARVGSTRSDTSYTYDDGGRLRRADGSNDWYVLNTWDDLDRLAMTQAHGGTHRFSYDSDGLLLTDESTTDPLLGTITHARDAEGRATQTTNTSSRGTQTWSFGYDTATGELKTRTTSEGSTAWLYDTFGRTRSVKTTSSQNTVVQDVAYEYDSNSNVVEERVNGGPDFGGRYTYDWANRLVGSKARDAQGNFESPYLNNGIGWGWDKAGNRIYRVQGAGSEEWTYDERNRPIALLGENDYASTRTDYNVDARGNVTGIGDRQLQFDARDDLVADSGVRYEYDALGRVQRRNNASFDYAGLSDDPSIAIDGTGNKEYSIRGSAGEILGTAGLYYSGGIRDTRMALADRHTDVTGGIALTGPAGANGAAVGATSFDPFGQRQGPAPLQGFSNRGSSFGFQSDWADSTTGAVQMGARWYDPESAIFLSRDDTSLALLSPGNLNRYGYADGNPLSKHDPSGRSTSTLPDIDFGKEFQRIVDGWHIDELEKQFRPVANEVGEWVAKGGLMRALGWVGRGAAWLGSRMIPYVGWGLLAVDVYTVGSWLLSLPRTTVPPSPPGPPAPPEPPEPPRTVPTVDVPLITSKMSSSNSWVAAGTRVTVTAEGGSRVITTSWLADHYLESRIDYSSGASEWVRNYIGREVVDSVRDVVGLVVDPTRVDQTHDVPGVAKEPWQQVAQGPSATDDGGCGIAGTLVSCAGEARGIEASCAPWGAPAAVCATLSAKPGPAGSVGPATATGSVADAKAPSTGGAGGSSKGGGGNWKPPKWVDEFDCDDLPDSDRTQGLRKEFENGIRQEYWKDEAASNPGPWSSSNLTAMQKGRAPFGIDGNPMEVHHILPLYMGGDNARDNLTHLTQTDHRLGENYKTNHPC